MVTVAVLAVLATVFALGYASGCSAYKTDDEVKTSEPVVTAETVATPAPEQSPVEPSAPPEETTEPARHRDDIVSEGLSLPPCLPLAMPADAVRTKRMMRSRPLSRW